MPLPRRVNQMDMEGTRVTPAAFEPMTSRRNRKYDKTSSQRSGNLFSRFGNIGCVIQVLIALVFILVIVGLCSSLAWRV